MQFAIDFSLYSSPVVAYGVVTGFLDSSDLIRVGDDICLLSSTVESNSNLNLKVVAISCEKDVPILGLADLVVGSPEEAALLAHRLEVEAGLFCDVY